MKHLFLRLSLMCALVFLNFQTTFASVLIQSSYPVLTQKDRQSYNFGQVFVNSRHQAVFTITNTGDAALTYKTAFVQGFEFDADHNCSKGLQPKQTCKFAVYYWPSWTGFHQGLAELDFNEDQIIIQLFGQAY